MATTPSFLPGVWPVFGHAWAVQLLQRTLTSAAGPAGGRGPSHAYLFLGAPQVGKTTLARAFAAALLCTEPTQAPCGICRSCKLLAHGNHPDFRLLQPLDTQGAVDRLNGALRSEQAAELVREVALTPVEGRWRVFLLQDMQAANATFANKILKTLEEPPDQTVLLLTAVDRSAVLPTIVSRCQLLELRPLDPPTVAAALQSGWQTPPAQAELLARLASGRLGWAVDQVLYPDRWQQRQEQLAALWRLAAADRVERLAFAATLAANRSNRQLFGLLAVWTTWWRDVLLVQAGCADACSNVDLLETIRRYAQAVEEATVRSFLLTLRQIEGYLHHTVNTRLALDVLLLQLPVVRCGVRNAECGIRRPNPDVREGQ